MFTTFAEIIAIVMAVLFAIANIAYYAPSSMSRLNFAKEKSASHDSSSGVGSDSGSDSISGISSNDKSSYGHGGLDNAPSGSNDITTNKVGDGAVVEVKPQEQNTSGFPSLDNLANPDQITTYASKDQSSGSGSGSSSGGSSSDSSSCSRSCHKKNKINCEDLDLTRSEEKMQ
jgi:hypothetical protein